MLHFVSEYDPSTTGFEARFKIDLTEELIKNPNSTYLIQMDSDELLDSHIKCGDILVIDRSLTIKSGHLAMVYLNGQKLVRFYHKSSTKIVLFNSKDGKNTPYILKEGDLFEVFGVVVNLLRKLEQFY